MQPDAKDYINQYVKAVYDFATVQKGEITLDKGDIIKVTSVVDSNWLHGTVGNKEGNFPISFVEKISIPAVHEGQKVFAAVENFPAQQDGDLEFRKGAIIIGIQQIDGNWWTGKHDSHTGIFPVTHVMELAVPKMLRERSKSVHSSEPMFAQALCDSMAQLDEELGFKTGDMITVTEVIDADWYMGELNGKSGMFLSSCVELIKDSYSEEHTRDSSTTSAVNGNHYDSYDSYTNQNSEIDDAQYAGHIGSNSTSDSPVLENSDRIPLNQHSSIISGNDSHSQDGEIMPYAKTLYPFTGESPGELTFMDNEIVHLIQHVDDQWIEGEIDGKIGMFPASFVSIVVDCPYANGENQLPENLQADFENSSLQSKHEQNSGINQDLTSTESSITPSALSVQQEISKHSQDEVEQEEEVYGLVLYNFEAETEMDLNLHEGDTVVILKHLDDNWVKARDEHGAEGLCPLHFIEVIGASPNDSPESETKSVQNSIEPQQNKDNSKFVDTNHQNEIIKNESVTEVKDKVMPRSVSDSKVNNLKAVDQETHQNFKLPFKPKPNIGPKPSLKPKPVIKPKPTGLSGKGPVKPSVDFSALSLSSEGSGITKSSSTHSLDMPHTNLVDSEKEPMKRTSSSNELRRAALEQQNLHNISEPVLSDDVESRSRSSSNLSSGSSESSHVANQSQIQHRPYNDHDFSVAFKNSDDSVVSVKRNSVSFPLPTQTADNVSRQTHARTSTSVSKPPNFRRSQTEESKFTTGQSTFFVDPLPDLSQNKPTVHMRKPPPPPLQRAKAIEQDNFERKPSLRKAPPPRPTGPRLASAPPKVPLVPVRVEGSRPAPARPAPKPPSVSVNRPTQTAPPQHRSGLSPPRRPPPRAPSPRTPSSLRVKSPSKDLIDMNSPEEPNAEIINDLKKRIKEVEDDLEKCKNSKQELQLMLQNIDEDDTDEIHDNVAFYDANIAGMTDELKSLRENLQDVCPKESDEVARQVEAERRREEEEKRKEEERKRMEELKQKRKEKRINVIEELMKTEKSFLFSLNLCIETFLSPQSDKHPEVDLDVVFGNIEEIADVSHRLLTSIENGVNGKDFQDQIIGASFIELSEDMKNTYAPYCRNHDVVITVLEKYRDNPSITEYFDKMLIKLKKKMIVFDLEALLIKPVQRILKYPLLLDELAKATEDDHKDKTCTVTAINAMADVATAINEYKRRKDLVFKYKKDAEESLGDKLAKISFHTLRKKGSRFKGRLSTNLGFTPQTKDETFDREEARFRQLEKLVKIFTRDVQTYMEQVQESVSCHEILVADIEDFYGDKVDSEVQRYQKVHRLIDGTFLPEFTSSVTEQVISPLQRLLQMFEAPTKVIQKRFDKLLDYDSLLSKYKDERASEKALQSAKNDYEALNAQLLDELPKMYNLSFQLLQDCICTFVMFQREYSSKVLHHMSELLDLPSLLSSGDNVVEDFNIKHVTQVDRLSLLSFIPKGFNPKMDMAKQVDKKSKRQSLDPTMTKVLSDVGSRQIDSQRVFIQQQYPPTKLYRVTKTYKPTDLMDIGVFEGDIVGVVQEKDPMGNKDRWFVDNGSTKGFLPKNMLVLHQTSPPQPAHPIQSLVSQPVLEPTSLSVSASAIGPPLSPSAIVPPHSPSLIGQQHSPSANRQQYSPSVGVPQQPADDDDDEFDFALDEDMSPNITINTSTSSGHDDQFYMAEFPFNARSDNETSLFQGQVVTVINKHDQQGNVEWWYVDADGKRGYAPSNYLHPMG